MDFGIVVTEFKFPNRNPDSPLVELTFQVIMELLTPQVEFTFQVIKGLLTFGLQG